LLWPAAATLFPLGWPLSYHFHNQLYLYLGSKPGKGREGSPAAVSGGVSNADPLANEQIKPPAPETTPKPAAPKNETPHKFWAYVEPYCAPIQLEDVKFLEDLIKVGVNQGI
jgi:hypothetical protein